MVREISRENDDRFSHYFDPATYRRFQASTSGQFSGIGLSVSEAKRGLRVVPGLRGHPGRRGGDQRPATSIVAVSGESIAGVSSTAAATRIKGPPGTEVTITVVDGETGRQAADLDVERAEVKIPAVESRLERSDGRKIGYVRLATFSRGAHGELRDAIDSLYEDGAEGLVFDLRANGGGLLDEAVLTTSIFQEEGPVVTIEGRARPEQTLDGDRRSADRSGPDRRARRRQHRLGLRDRHRGAAAERPGDRGRRPGPSARASSRR